MDALTAGQQKVLTEGAFEAIVCDTIEAFDRCKKAHTRLGPWCDLDYHIEMLRAYLDAGRGTRSATQGVTAEGETMNTRIEKRWVDE